MRPCLLATFALLTPIMLATGGTALADQRFEARLAGHAVLPAASFVPPPPGAPPGFVTSGRFTGPGNSRVEQRGALGEAGVGGEVGVEPVDRVVDRPPLAAEVPEHAVVAQADPTVAVRAEHWSAAHAAGQQ